MNAFPAAATLLLEAVFTGLFARSAFAGLAVVITFLAAVALRRPDRGPRFAAALYVPSLVYCLWLCRSLEPVPFLLMMGAQQAQALCFLVAPRPGKGKEPQARLNSGALVRILFLGYGLVTVYFTFAGTAIPPEPVSRAMGTVILLLSVLSLDFRRPEPTRRKEKAGAATPYIRAAVVLVMVYLALQVATPLARPSVRAAGSMLAQLSRFLQRKRDRAELPSVPPRGDRSPATKRSRRTVSGWAKETIHDPVFAHVHLQVDDPKDNQWLRQRLIYLRSKTFDTFTETGWANSDNTARRLADANDGVADNKITLKRATSRAVTYNVYTRFLDGGVMPVIPSATAIHLPVVMEISGDTYASPLKVNLFRYSYTVTSTPKLWADVSGKSPKAAVTAGEYLDLQDTRLVAELSNLAYKTVGSSGDAGAVVEKLSRHLRTQYNYSRKWPATVNAKALESFLFESKPGNCQAFATALALMLRSLDIPARVGMGYCAGDYDPVNKLYSFYPDNAHAWTEVCLEDHGWVVVDSTPPSPTAVMPRKPEQVDLSLFPALEEVMDSGLLAKGTGLRTMISRSVLLFNLALGVLATILVFLSRRRGATPGSARSAPAVTSSSPDFYRVFCRSFRKAGCPIRTGQTAAEYLRVLKRERYLEDECDDIIRYLYRICYENGRRDAREERRMKARIRKLFEPG